MKLYDYTGVIHLHSAYSHDGRTPVEKIVEAAHANGIDFIMLTDHSTLSARRKGYEKWHGDVLLIVGQEISPRFNHYLAFGIDEALVVNEDDTKVKPQDYIDRVVQQGGIGFIAHPDHEGTSMFHVKHFPWKDWSVSGYTGIGVWDFMTDWQGMLRSIPRALAAYFFPAYVLRGPRKSTLSRWDTLNARGRFVGIGELDNHDTPYRIGGITIGIFPFKKALRFMRTHFLLDAPLSGKAGEDISALLAALKRGRVYIAMEYFRDAKGFSFTIADTSQWATMGDEFSLQGEAVLQVMIPGNGNIRVIKDGQLCCQASGSSIVHTVSGRGVYRVEAYAKIWGKYRPWIFSNPVYVR